MARVKGRLRNGRRGEPVDVDLQAYWGGLHVYDGDGKLKHTLSVQDHVGLGLAVLGKVPVEELIADQRAVKLAKMIVAGAKHLGAR